MLQLKLKSVLIFSGLVFTSPLLWAASVKHDAVAAKGCTRMATMTQAESALRRFNLTTIDARDSEIIALGTGLMWIEELNGGRPLAMATYKGARAYAFKFENNSGSRQWGTYVKIGRKSMPYGANVAQLIHELGHLVGNQGAYGMYRKAMNNTYCKVSSYSDDKANEQFAEVFAAFVTKPELLADNKSKACQKAFAFFKNTLFAKGARASQCKNNDGSLAM